jgi:hypothetical protein
MYQEHKHDEYEEGMVEITVSYFVITRKTEDEYKGQENFNNYEEALSRYNELKDDKNYSMVALNEEQTYTVTRLCRCE